MLALRTSLRSAYRAFCLHLPDAPLYVVLLAGLVRSWAAADPTDTLIGMGMLGFGVFAMIGSRLLEQLTQLNRSLQALRQELGPALALLKGAQFTVTMESLDPADRGRHN